MNFSHDMPFASTPYHDTKAVNKTFDISQISPLTSDHQKAATIAAEVSAAAATQASREFRHMCKPKITKLKGLLS